MTTIEARAHADLQRIMAKQETCAITDPSGSEETFNVISSDIHISSDPGTGIVVTGRQSSVAVYIADLIAAGFDGIRGIADPNSRPWLVTISDVNGREGTFKVAETHPDNTAGLMLLMLEEYTS